MVYPALVLCVDADEVAGRVLVYPVLELCVDADVVGMVVVRAVVVT